MNVEPNFHRITHSYGTSTFSVFCVAHNNCQQGGTSKGSIVPVAANTEVCLERVYEAKWTSSSVAGVIAPFVRQVPVDDKMTRRETTTVVMYCKTMTRLNHIKEGTTPRKPKAHAVPASKNHANRTGCGAAANVLRAPFACIWATSSAVTGVNSRNMTARTFRLVQHARVGGISCLGAPEVVAVLPTGEAYQ